MAVSKLQVQAPSINPNAAFASAAKIFSNIEDARVNEENLKSLDEYRQSQMDAEARKMAWTEGATQRAIDEENRKRQQSAERGLFGERVAQEAGGSRVEPLLANIMQDQRFAGIDNVEEKLMQFADQNKALVSDPQTYRDTVRKNALASGQFTYEEAEALAQAKTAELFPTASQDTIDAMVTALKGAPGYGGSGSGSAYGKDATPGRTLDTEGLAGEIAEARGLVKVPDTSFIKGLLTDDPRWDVGQLDAAQSDISHVIGRLQALGITDQEALRATVNEAFDPAYGNKIKDKYNWRTDEGIKELANYGANQQAIQSRKVGGSANVAANQQGYLNAVDSIFARGTTQRATDEELVNKFFESISIPQQPKIPQRGNPTAGENSDVNTQGNPAGTPPPGNVPNPAPAAADVQGPILSDLGTAQAGPTLNEASLVDILGAVNEKAGQGIIDNVSGAANWFLNDVVNAVPQFDNPADAQSFKANLEAKANADFASLTPAEKIWVEKLGIKVKK